MQHQVQHQEYTGRRVVVVLPREATTLTTLKQSFDFRERCKASLIFSPDPAPWTAAKVWRSLQLT
ncbi:MAG: hypothetical protein WBA43_13585 [Elainellaceae cyanobacterium]